jgi:hypothetical protein
VLICRDKSRYEAGKPSRILPGTVRTSLLVAESSDFSQAARVVSHSYLFFKAFFQAHPSHWFMAFLRLSSTKASLSM